MDPFEKAVKAAAELVNVTEQVTGVYLGPAEEAVTVLYAEIQFLTLLLRQIEWVVLEPGRLALCPTCRGAGPNHLQGCTLASALERLRVALPE
jgi:hypothetical protein